MTTPREKFEALVDDLISWARSTAHRQATIDARAAVLQAYDEARGVGDKDRARYKWLRENLAAPGPRSGEALDLLVEIDNPEEFDEVVDAAMSGESKG